MPVVKNKSRTMDELVQRLQKEIKADHEAQQSEKQRLDALLEAFRL